MSAASHMQLPRSRRRCNLRSAHSSARWDSPFFQSNERACKVCEPCCAQSRRECCAKKSEGPFAAGIRAICHQLFHAPIPLQHPPPVPCGVGRVQIRSDVAQKTPAARTHFCGASSSRSGTRARSTMPRCEKWYVSGCGEEVEEDGFGERGRKGSHGICAAFFWASSAQ